MTEETKQKPIIVRSFGANPTKVLAGEPVTLFWDVSNAETIEFDPPQNGDFKLPRHTLVLHPAKTFEIKLIAKAGDLISEHPVTITVDPTKPHAWKKPEEPKDLPEGLTAVKYKHPLNDGRFGLVIEGGIEVNDPDRPGVVEAGLCPVCKTPAEPWEPPVHEVKYQQRIERIEQENGMQDATTDELHAAYVKQTGCVLTRCKQCGTGYIVPASAVKIKASS
jgi:hypothetical protein